ncbi:MAG: M48 family metallopeptidase [Bacteroidaceae bacterium]|nr:M48 family metallopeptidase [Bacteroidaceae bacterium]
MEKSLCKTLIASLAVAMLTACGTASTVPITGRTQRLMVTDEQVLSLSNQEYNTYMQTAKLSTDATNTAMVKRVGERLANAVVTYLTNNGYANDAQTYSWVFNLVQDASANAFCMPGGKIVVYDGLLPITQTETALAIVLGHEIAHAVAKHSAERMSNQIKQQYGTQVLSGVLAGVGASSTVQSLGNIAIGLGSKVGSAAYSRKQESEADHLGLVFAAMAGYDPSQAVPFWQRMSEATGGGSRSIFSDHPSDAKRIEDIQKWLPEAQKYYTPQVVATSAKASTGTTKSTKKTTSKKK